VSTSPLLSVPFRSVGNSGCAMPDGPRSCLRSSQQVVSAAQHRQVIKMSEAIEQWAPTRYPGYDVSTDGRVRGPRRILSTRPDTNGYLSVGIYADGKSKTIRVHAEVAHAFLGKRPDGHQVAHSNGDRLDARLSNLSYKTRSMNEADKRAHGTALLGERNPQAKLTDRQVSDVICRVSNGESKKSVARSLGVSSSHIFKIWRGRSRCDHTALRSLSRMEVTYAL